MLFLHGSAHLGCQHPIVFLCNTCVVMHFWSVDELFIWLAGKVTEDKFHVRKRTNKRCNQDVDTSCDIMAK